MCDRQCIWGINTSGVFYLSLLKLCLLFVGHVLRTLLLAINRVANKYMILLLVLKPIWNDFCLG